MIRGESVDVCCWRVRGGVNTAAVANVRPMGPAVDRSRFGMEKGTVGGTPEGNTVEKMRVYNLAPA